MESRDHWLYRLRRLGRCHAPYLPSDANVSEMTDSELRELVIHSLRQYRFFFPADEWMDDYDYYSSGGFPCRTFSWFDFGWNGISLPPSLTLKLLPGGRHLLASYVPKEGEGGFKDLEIWKLDQPPRRVWSYHASVKVADIDKYTYHISTDPALMMLVVSSSMNPACANESEVYSNAETNWAFRNRLTFINIHMIPLHRNSSNNHARTVVKHVLWVHENWMPSALDINSRYAAGIRFDSYGSKILVVNMEDYKLTKIVSLFLSANVICTYSLRHYS